MNRWLKGQGSLTARLRQLGPMEVQVLSQGTRRLWPAERQAIGLSSGHVREVLLLVRGEPLVWARSVTANRALKGPWRALAGLGSRPLAELLFSHAQVTRGPIQRHHWPCRGPERSRARRAVLSASAAARPSPTSRPIPSPRWARASVFWHQGQALRVLESFSPQVQGHFTP
jgi:chorismate lyase